MEDIFKRLFKSAPSKEDNGIYCFVEAEPQASISRIKSKKSRASGYTYMSAQLSGLQANTVSLFKSAPSKEDNGIYCFGDENDGDCFDKGDIANWRNGI